MAFLAQLTSAHTLEVWVVLGLLAACGVLAWLHTLGACMQAERSLHDLRVRVAELRRSYSARLEAYRESGVAGSTEFDVESPAMVLKPRSTHAVGSAATGVGAGHVPGGSAEFTKARAA